ncbi:MAG: Major Facilitator Superfamily protein [Verrucomicrobia bacterium ADurb.Bin345]|nr:MAG: Major Facilitator Superfamily protein [Verrucomicrobia bacterium ADurb.Bin345]
MSFSRILKTLQHGLGSAESCADPEEARRRTRTLSVVEGGVWSFMAGFGDAFISPFAIFLKASNRAVALLSTMPVLLGAFSQMIGASLTDRLGRRRDVIVPLVTIQALAFLPLFLIPLFLPSHAVLAVLLCAGLAVACGHAATPAWMSLMGDVVPEAGRGDYFGRRGRVIILLVFLSTLSAGGVLTVMQQKGRVATGFAVLFSVACAARLLSARLLARHYDPPYRPTREQYFSFWDFLRRMPRSNFAKFALFFALMTGAANVAGPFFNVYMLRDLQWSYAQFTVNTAAFLVTQFVLVRWWGRIGDRHGNRVVLVTTSLLLPVPAVLWTLSTDYFVLLLVQIVAGAAWSGFSIGAQNFVYDAVTPGKRARISAYSTVLNGTFTLLGGTLLGAWLANNLPETYPFGSHTVTFLSPLPGVFIVSALLRALVAAIFLPLFREVRETERIHPVALLLRLSGSDILTGFIWQTVLRLTPPKGRSVRFRRPRSD